jgi:hypothetical protein
MTATLTDASNQLPPSSSHPQTHNIVNTPSTPASKNITDTSTNLKLDLTTPPSSLPSHIRTRLVTGALGVSSPVNQNGSFDFDRIIKSASILKRTRKTKQWKSYYLVLRPHLLSFYKDAEQTKLRHQIQLSELTAVARQKDPKGKMRYVVGFFTGKGAVHVSFTGEKEAGEWVDIVRREARIDEDELEEVWGIMSPVREDGNGEAFSKFHNTKRSATANAAEENRTGRRENQVLSSSSETELAQPSQINSNSDYTGPGRMHSSSVSSAAGPSSAVVPPRNIHSSQSSNRKPSNTLTYSGGEYGSFSDFSDGGPGGFGGVRGSNVSLSNTATHSTNQGVGSSSNDAARVYGLESAATSGTENTTRPKSQSQSNINASTASGFANLSLADESSERVVCQGWLHVLKSKGGVRQWRKVWAVLRIKGLALYKSEEVCPQAHHHTIRTLPVIPLNRVTFPVHVTPLRAR